MEPFFCCVNKKLFFTPKRFTQGVYNLNKQFIKSRVNAGLQYTNSSVTGNKWGTNVKFERKNGTRSGDRTRTSSSDNGF